MRRLVLASVGLGICALCFVTAAAQGGAAAGIRLSECGAHQSMRHVDGYRERLVAGNGPVLLVPVGGDGRARISIAESSPDRFGWRGQKTPWLVRKSYRGPVVVTARRIDRAGGVRFGFVYGQRLRRLDYSRDDRHPPVRGYYQLPSDTLFRSAGCYAFRVTGRGFAERLIVRVVA